MGSSDTGDFSTAGFSVVTALYNRLDLTRQYLNSLEDTLKHEARPYEVILVDDGSSDGTRDYLKTLKKPYHVEFNEVNLGYAASNNLGASLARYETLVFLNNDLVLQSGWLDPMLDGLEKLDHAGVIGNIQLNAKTRLIDHAGVFFDSGGLPAHARKGRKRIIAAPYVEWNAVTAACMVIRKSLFREAGGFDEVYRNGTEDIDLCVRLKSRGYRHYVANRSVILHHVSSSPGRTDFDTMNMEIFRKRWSHLTMVWGRREWAHEYLKRYARRWWKYNFKKFWRAVFILLFNKRNRIESKKSYP